MRATAAQVRAQLLSGPINADATAEVTQTADMTHAREVAPGKHLYTATLSCDRSGRYGFALRVVPGLANQLHPFEPGLIRWNG